MIRSRRRSITIVYLGLLIAVGSFLALQCNRYCALGTIRIQVSLVSAAEPSEVQIGRLRLFNPLREKIAYIWAYPGRNELRWKYLGRWFNAEINVSPGEAYMGFENKSPWLTGIDNVIVTRGARPEG